MRALSPRAVYLLLALAANVNGGKQDGYSGRYFKLNAERRHRPQGRHVDADRQSERQRETVDFLPRHDRRSRDPRDDPRAHQRGQLVRRGDEGEREGPRRRQALGGGGRHDQPDVRERGSGGRIIDTAGVLASFAEDFRRTLLRGSGPPGPDPAIFWRRAVRVTLSQNNDRQRPNPQAKFSTCGKDGFCTLSAAPDGCKMRVGPIYATT